MLLEEKTLKFNIKISFKENFMDIFDFSVCDILELTDTYMALTYSPP
jgi:hypothetical protein